MEAGGTGEGEAQALSEVALTAAELRTHQWRGLDGDHAQGGTAWAWKKHHERPDYVVLRSWALPGSCRTKLADYLAVRLKDGHSRAFYVKPLWRAARLERKPGVLVARVERVEADLREGWTQNPRALLAYRLSG
ncbi:hypothetical protein Marky_2107 [Marinithermus hydrothermalis DSM 14884]|uniref:Uncharacterized protein n=1 Tax=Marinithermus hydrothermalis (strain DSM 14884 / JCM 11576 / T1) TaxID=869210 RepID=F2NPQ6_MARHT|nr:hypothetical protein Marky_2107 [Marinithermus hydrothermalis DSM 14884]